jgi:hypothetical protein
MAKEAKKAQKKPSLEDLQYEICMHAEEIYKKRMAKNQPGDALSDWLLAEKVIKKKYGL